MKGIVSKGETALRTINWILIIFFCFLFLLPFWLVLMSSVTDEMTFVINGYVLVPKKFSLEGFKFIFGASDLILGSIKNSVIISLTATALTVVIVTMTAYVLSKKYLPGVKWLSLLFVVTMFFSGGTIPSYLVIRSIGLYDTIWALIIPSIGNVFYIVLMRSYFYSLPAALEEAGRHRRQRATCRYYCGFSCRSLCRWWRRSVSSLSSTGGTAGWTRLFISGHPAKNFGPCNT